MASKKRSRREREEELRTLDTFHFRALEVGAESAFAFREHVQLVESTLASYRNTVASALSKGMTCSCDLLAFVKTSARKAFTARKQNNEDSDAAADLDDSTCQEDEEDAVRTLTKMQHLEDEIAQLKAMMAMMEGLQDTAADDTSDTISNAEKTADKENMTEKQEDAASVGADVLSEIAELNALMGSTAESDSTDVEAEDVTHRNKRLKLALPKDVAKQKLHESIDQQNDSICLDTGSPLP